MIVNIKCAFLASIVLTVHSAAADLSIAAASDLARAAPDLAAAYRKNAGHAARFSFASSGALARQIENGAPYDVFLAANEAFVNEGLQKAWLKPGTGRAYAAGHLALWSRSGKFARLEDLTHPSVRHVAIANPAHAPYGAAAAQALANAGVWESLKPRIVYGENIRQALQYAESGNADAAIVAWSLVFDRGGVRLPDALYDEIRQSGAVVASTRQADAATRFLAFLGSPLGRDILARHGFRPL